MQKFIYLILFISFTLPLSSQNFWKQLDNSTLSQFRNSEEIVLPQEFSTFVLDAKGLQSFLTDAPNEFGSGADLMVDIPMPEGNLKRFTISYSPVMQEGLAKKYLELALNSKSAFPGKDVAEKTVSILKK